MHAFMEIVCILPSEYSLKRNLKIISSYMKDIFKLEEKTYSCIFYKEVKNIPFYRNKTKTKCKENPR